MAIALQKQDLARFHAGQFQPAYIPAEKDHLQATLAPGWCQSRPNTPFVNGNGGPLYGRDVLPAMPHNPTPRIGFQPPFYDKDQTANTWPNPIMTSTVWPNSLCYSKQGLF